MRSLVPWVLGFVVLVALWPALCMSQEDRPTTCQSALLLPLPWGEGADTWGYVVAVIAASATFYVARFTFNARATSHS